jgi:tRNA G26 N,N-dimethylase Trm1
MEEDHVLMVESSEIREGAAKIVLSDEATTFYNPIQEFNRDLT